MKWTTEKIETFWKMKDEGCTLAEIAEVLGTTYGSVAMKSKKINKAKKTREEAAAEMAENKTKTECIIMDSQNTTKNDKLNERTELYFNKALEMADLLGVEILAVDFDLIAESVKIEGRKDNFSYCLEFSREDGEIAI